MTRFPISFDRWYRTLSMLVGLPPSSSYVVLDGEEMQVRMGWAFRAHIPRRAVAEMSLLDRKPISRGVHGFAGVWLVNGSGSGILDLRLDPSQRAHVLGVPVRLRRLLVSVEEPANLAAALGHTV